MYPISNGVKDQENDSKTFQMLKDPDEQPLRKK
jgi:hypothetical protein